MFVWKWLAPFALSGFVSGSGVRLTKRSYKDIDGSTNKKNNNYFFVYLNTHKTDGVCFLGNTPLYP